MQSFLLVYCRCKNTTHSSIYNILTAVVFQNALSTTPLFIATSKFLLTGCKLCIHYLWLSRPTICHIKNFLLGKMGLKFFCLLLLVSRDSSAHWICAVCHKKSTSFFRSNSWNNFFCCSHKEHKRQLEYAYMVRTQTACGFVKKVTLVLSKSNKSMLT